MAHRMGEKTSALPSAKKTRLICWRKHAARAICRSISGSGRMRKGTSLYMRQKVQRLCEQPLVTLGDDFENVVRFCGADRPDYSAEDVIRTLLG